MGWGTYIVIAGGIACFLLASLTAKYIYQAFKPYKSTINSSSIQLIRMRRWKVYISTLFCGVIFLLLFKYIRNFSGSGNIASIISSYRIASLKGEIQFPTVINLLNKVLVASGYISHKQLFNSKKNRFVFSYQYNIGSYVIFYNRRKGEDDISYSERNSDLFFLVV